HGHADDLASDGGQASIRYFLEQGFDVLALYMPDYGPNIDPVETHNRIMALASDTAPWHPLRYFLEPIAVALNQALADRNYDSVAMMGISGGGWATTVAAALDPRIRYSFPVAGSLPLYMRQRADDLGDAEQYDEAFYSIAGYPDLYVMGAAGEGRRQVQ